MASSEQVNILVVSDLVERRRSVASMLSDLGHHVVQATSGGDALRILRNDEYAAVILDTDISDMDSLSTARRIRRRKRCEHTPILLITRSEEDVDAIASRALDGIDPISSPPDPQLLISKVSELVDLFHKTEFIRQRAAHREQLAREQGGRQAAEKAMRRSKLLAEASRVLSRSLDFDATLTTLQEVMTPAIADACQLILYDADGNLWFAPQGPRESTNDRQTKSTSGRIRMVEAQLADTVREVISSGHVRTVDGELVRGAPNLQRKSKWPAVVIAPLIARDIPLGAIICCRRGSRRKFNPSETALIEDIAGRAATALDNAQLHQTIRDGERRKDEFLAMLGHELRNPLAAIANAGELTKLLSPNEPAFLETLEVIRQQATLMRRLVDDLLDVSRITSGRIQLQKTTVWADEIMAQVAESTNALFTSRSHALRLSVPKDRVRFEADPCRLEQVLSNLLVNAAKYTEPGGEISLTVLREGQEVVFCVKDSGIGIGPDLLPYVFDLFSQANRSLHRSEGGLGIGLTIVKGLTELHGGRVWATSNGVGRGAEFFVCLPIHAKGVTDGKPPPNGDFRAGSFRRRVLVVEDQPALLHVTVALLRKLGHEVAAAADGREALLAVQEHQPDVVFLDIGLPGMDGYEVAQRLRSDMGGAAPVLVAMTGYGEHEVNRHAAKAKFDFHLVKPADTNAMQALLSQVEISG